MLLLDLSWLFEKSEVVGNTDRLSVKIRLSAFWRSSMATKIVILLKLCLGMLLTWYVRCVCGTYAT